MKKDRAVWTEKQTQQFFSALSDKDPFWHSICSLAIMTGLRAGELYALKWEDVNYEERFIRVTAAYNHKDKRVHPSTKTGKNRFVPLSSQLSSLLRDLIQRTKDTHFIVPRNSTFDHGTQSKMIFNLSVLANVPPIRFHDFRALYASRLLLSGVSMVGVMQVCGWSQLSTAQRYLRLSGRDVVGLTDGITFPV